MFTHPLLQVGKIQYASEEARRSDEGLTGAERRSFNTVSV